MAPKTNVVKVKAFPIKAKMSVDAGVSLAPAPTTVETQILKLTTSGFLMEAKIAGLIAGAKFQIDFELPVVHFKISQPCTVVKLYNTKDMQMIEGHFQSIAAVDEQHILKFLSRIPKSAG